MKNEVKLKSEVYIGKNGIGKTIKLNDIFNKNETKSLLIKFSEKTNAPDDNVLNKKNEVLNNFQKFLNKIFMFETSIDEDKFSNEDRKKIKEIKNKIGTQKELDEKWSKFKEDKILSFLNNFEPNILQISNKKLFSVEKKFIEFNFDKWKQTKNNNLQNHGTGKLVYFQIKFLFQFLKIIPNNELKKFNLIIDEPELFLHNTLKKQVGFLLRKINEKINVFIATHSSQILNSFFKYNHTEIFTKNNFEDKKWINTKLKNVHIFPSRQIYFEILMTNKIIICEGNNDVKLLNYIILDFLDEKYEKDILILNSTSLQETGKDKIKFIYDIVQGIKDKNDNPIINNSQIFILYDEDENKKNKNQNNKNTKIDHEKINKEIENINQDVKKYSFKSDLEQYFQINNKKKWNEYDFFDKNVENIKKLNCFLEESFLEEFLKI